MSDVNDNPDIAGARQFLRDYMNRKKPTSRETDEPFGWQSLIALYVPKLQHILYFFLLGTIYRL